VREVKHTQHSSGTSTTLLYSTKCKDVHEQRQAACSAMSRPLQQLQCIALHDCQQWQLRAICFVICVLRKHSTSRNTHLRQLTPTALHSAHTTVSSATAAVAAVTVSTRAYMCGTVLLRLHTPACARAVCHCSAALGATI
jgi:hypothetical protein